MGTTDSVTARWYAIAKHGNQLRDQLGTEGMKAIIHERYGTKFDRKLITAA